MAITNRCSCSGAPGETNAAPAKRSTAAAKLRTDVGRGNAGCPRVLCGQGIAREVDREALELVADASDRQLLAQHGVPAQTREVDEMLQTRLHRRKRHREIGVRSLFVGRLPDCSTERRQDSIVDERRDADGVLGVLHPRHRVERGGDCGHRVHGGLLKRESPATPCGNNVTQSI